jgi:hypothetical protein
MFLISSSQMFWNSIAPTRAIRRVLEVAAVVVVSCLAMVLWPVERVTWEDFDRIGIGMTRSEVRRLLVRWPDEQFVAEGQVVGPKAFHWGRIPGHRDDPPGRFPAYHVEAWEAPGLSIIVVFENNDRVGCRFTGTGHGRKDWLAVLLPSYRGWIARLF